MRSAVLLFLIALPVEAAERDRLHGAWGTPNQCARAPIKAGGTVRAEPFIIGADWLKHGQLWCRLQWFPIETRKDGLFTGAYAHCGEDSVRTYLLGMDLSGEQLTLRWEFPHKNGPLSRC